MSKPVDKEKQKKKYLVSLRFFEFNIILFSVGGIITAILSTAAESSPTASASIFFFLMQFLSGLVFMMVSVVLKEKKFLFLISCEIVTHVAFIICQMGLFISLYVYAGNLLKTTDYVFFYYSSAGAFALLSFSIHIPSLVVASINLYQCKKYEWDTSEKE